VTRDGRGQETPSTCFFILPNPPCLATPRWLPVMQNKNYIIIQHSPLKNVCTTGRLNSTQTLHGLVTILLFIHDKILPCPFDEQAFFSADFLYSLISNSVLAVLESKRTYRALLLKLTVYLAMWQKESL